jgi:hypothetical protein
MGSGNIDPPLLASALDRGEWPASRLSRYISEQIFHLLPRNSLNGILGGTQSHSGSCGEEKSLVSGSPARSPSVHRLS